jgi:hypothetical protein
VLRAAVVCEAAGIASVSLVCEGFERQASATARALGFDSIPLATLCGHVDSQSTDEMVSLLRAHTVRQVVDGLTVAAAPADTATAEPLAQEIVVRGTVEEVNAEFHRRGWTDGLPIIPPTIGAVESLITDWGYDPWRVIGIAQPSGRDMTVWSIAVNAVMAGCTQEQLPVLVGLAQVLADDHYGVQHSGNTTGADAQIIVSGPMVSVLGFNHGQGALREGTHANTAVARWLRLYQRNVCGFTADEHDKATFGNSTRVVLAEDDDALHEIGWPALSTDLGATPGTDTVTVARMNGALIIGSVYGSTPERIIPYLADGLVRVTGWELTHVFGLGHGDYRPLLVISPGIARIFARARWSKEDVRSALFEHARMPAFRFEALIGGWSNLTAGNRSLTSLVDDNVLPAEFAKSDDPHRLVPIVLAPSHIMIAVAGDPNRMNAYVMSNDGLHGQWTWAQVSREYSSDLVCIPVSFQQT